MVCTFLIKTILLSFRLLFYANMEKPEGSKGGIGKCQHLHIKLETMPGRS